MSLSPLVSFKSRFVTYLLNFPRMMHGHTHIKYAGSFSEAAVWYVM